METEPDLPSEPKEETREVHFDFRMDRVQEGLSALLPAGPGDESYQAQALDQVIAPALAAIEHLSADGTKPEVRLNVLGVLMATVVMTRSTFRTVFPRRSNVLHLPAELAEHFSDAWVLPKVTLMA